MAEPEEKRKPSEPPTRKKLRAPDVEWTYTDSAEEDKKLFEEEFL